MAMPQRFQASSAISSRVHDIVIIVVVTIKRRQGMSYPVAKHLLMCIPFDADLSGMEPFRYADDALEGPSSEFSECFSQLALVKQGKDGSAVLSGT
jgi:hypothetical protein